MPRRPKVRRGRWTSRIQPARYGGAVLLKGSEIHSSKLTEKIVATARRLHKKGVSLTVLAKRYKVNLSTMSRAVNRLTFRHVR
jgi:DNA invertase Pin-like site-specific DNA recombinase